VKVRYSPQAGNDPQDNFQYRHDRSPSGVENVMRAIYAGIEFLAENSMASQETGLPEIRVKIVRRYRVDRDTIDLIHIRHAARRPFAKW
jgi:plasmid stabilization system protein ParE